MIYSSLINTKNIIRISFLYLVILAIWQLYSNPYLWFDESILLYHIHHSAILENLIPGLSHHFLGIQALLLTILSIIYKSLSFIPILYLILLINFLCLMKLLKEIQKIFEYFNISSQSTFLCCLFICMSPAIQFYVSDSRPYLIESALSLVVIRKFIKKENINFYYYLLTFFISIQTSIILGVVTLINIVEQKNRNDIYKIIILVATSLTYVISLNIFQPNYLLFMKRFWTNQSALSFLSFNNLLVRVQNLITLPLNSNKLYIFVPLIILILKNIFSPLKRLSIFIFLTLFILTIFSVLGRYPLLGIDQNIIFLDLRINLSIISSFLVIYVLFLDQLSKKNVNFIIMAIFIYSLSNLSFKFDNTFFPKNKVVDNINSPVKSIHHLDPAKKFCLAGTLAKIYWVNSFYKIIKERSDIVIMPNYDQLNERKDELNCNIVTLSWESIASVTSNPKLLQLEDQFGFYKIYKLMR